MSKQANQDDYTGQELSKAELKEMLRVNYVIADYFNFYKSLVGVKDERFSDITKNIERIAKKNNIDIDMDLEEASKIGDTVYDQYSIENNLTPSKEQLDNVNAIHDELQKFNEDFEKNQSVTVGRVLKFAIDVLNPLKTVPFALRLTKEVLEASWKIGNSKLRGLEKKYTRRAENQQESSESWSKSFRRDQEQLARDDKESTEQINKIKIQNQKIKEELIEIEKRIKENNDIVPKQWEIEKKNNLEGDLKHNDQTVKKLQNASDDYMKKMLKKQFDNIEEMNAADERANEYSKKAHQHKASTIYKAAKDKISESAGKKYGNKNTVKVGSHLDRVNKARKNAKPKTPGI